MNQYSPDLRHAALDCVRERSVDISMALFPSVPLTTGKSKLFPLRVMIAFSDSLIKNAFRELGFYNPFKRVNVQ